jgi:uncharacterized membrane protein
MDAGFWRNVGLLLHVIGIVALSGGSIGGTVTDLVFWRTYQKAPVESKALAALSVKLGVVAEIGSMSMILSGLVLLFADSWVWWGQIWLTLKLVLFVLLALNGALVASPAGRALNKLMEQWVVVNGGAPVAASVSPGGTATMTATATREWVETELNRLHQRLRYFHVSETAGFLAILVLAVFKFN